jgi:hypothetical protein
MFQKIAETYNAWYSNNREKLVNDEFNPVDIQILQSPELDNLKSVNIISYLSESVNDSIDNFVNKYLGDIVSESFLIPRQSRHITILDIIPHNLEYSIEELENIAYKVSSKLETNKSIFDKDVEIILQGIFASPDGITLQGYVQNDNLTQIRNELRELLAEDLMEKSKYVTQTAHIALIKFTKKLDGKSLVTLVDKLRETPITRFIIDNYSLSISTRYDKHVTSKNQKIFDIIQ